MINEYDEIKQLLKKSRMLQEQVAPPVNIDADIEGEEEFETAPQEDKSKTYRVSGGLIKLNGKTKQDLELSTEEKIAFQETMDDFIDQVSDMSDYGTLNVYPNNVEWSGKIIDKDIDFMYSIGESSGIYINGDMIKVDADFLDTINKLSSYYDQFKAKWAKIIAQRKKTKSVESEE
jgi:hypothetical protein